MKSHELLEVIGEAQDTYVLDVKAPKKKSTPTWVKWVAMAACLCIMVGLAIPTILSNLNPNEEGAGTLVGDTEIYPTVMVDGHLYEWRKGAAICNELPNNSMYYGELVRIDGESPTKDCEFVSVFSVSGQIYTVSENSDCVYLCLTTDWLNKTVVVFDLVAHDSPAD